MEVARGEKGSMSPRMKDPWIFSTSASLGWDLERHIEMKELAILNAGTYLSSLPGTGKIGI
jgi:hypothetical protein